MGPLVWPPVCPTVIVMLCYVILSTHQNVTTDWAARARVPGAIPHNARHGGRGTLLDFGAERSGVERSVRTRHVAWERRWRGWRGYCNGGAFYLTFTFTRAHPGQRPAHSARHASDRAYMSRGTAPREGMKHGTNDTPALFGARGGGIRLAT